MQGIILSPIVEVFMDLIADFKIFLWGHCDIAAIEKPMDIGSEQKAIADAVFPALTERFDMGRIQGGKDLFLRHGTSTFIGVGHDHPECPLS
jgi:hypothetical protein